MYGNDDDELYACPECSTKGDRANCAGTSSEADGSLYVHKPGLDEPVPAVFRDDEEEETDPNERLTLDEAREREEASTVGVGSQDENSVDHDDQEFAAIVAK